MTPDSDSRTTAIEAGELMRRYFRSAIASMKATMTTQLIRRLLMTDTGTREVENMVRKAEAEKVSKEGTKGKMVYMRGKGFTSIVCLRNPQYVKIVMEQKLIQ